MQFRRVRITVKHSIMNTKGLSVYEHEVPIYQARFGFDSVNPAPDTDTCGPVMVTEITGERNEHNDPITRQVPQDVTLSEEWDRLINSGMSVQVSETDRRPAAIVAFPRGVLDLEDFYKRIRGDNVVRIQEAPVQDALSDETSGPSLNKQPEKAKSERDLMKEQLDAMGIEYKGNASNKALRELLDEVKDGSTAVQNEG